MKRINLLISAFALLGFALTFPSCKEDEPAPIKEATSISIISGSGQTAQIETALPNPIEVIVKDQNGDAFAGTAVTFSVAEGSVSAATAITDAEGKAKTNWTVGSTVGTQTLSITAFKKDGVTALAGSSLTVTATTTPIPRIATTIELTDLGEQDGAIGTTLPLPIEVIVKDQFGEVLQGATVNFSVTEGSVTSPTETTDVQGKASVSWTLGSTIGQQTLSITAFKADGTTPLAGSPMSKFAYGYKPKTVTDIDGNVYPYVVIGTQVWMAENLKATKYNDGTAIPLELDDIGWSNLTSPAYSWYDNNEANKDTYGALYNWYVVSSAKNGGKNVCPVGWHVPSHTEWRTLIDFLGGNSIAGGKLKEQGHTHWFDAPTSGGSNEVGFTALPGGKRDKSYKKFLYLTYHAFWWTSTEYIDIWDEASIAINIIYDGGSIGDHTYYRKDGLSVRCIED